MWLLYEILLFIGLLLYVPNALWRRRLPHQGWSMRLGRYPRSVTERLRRGGAIWLHAVSVGEVRSVEPLIAQLLARYPETPLVLSTVTPTGCALASQVVGDRGVAIYAPVDFRFAIRRALDAIQPKLLILVESELWPTLLRLTKQRQVPIAVVNGRVSARAFRRYLWVRPWLWGVLRLIDLLLMQSDTDAARILKMDAPSDRVRVIGSLKWDASLLSRSSAAELERLVGRLGLATQDRLIVAGSTHRGEERAVLKAFQQLRAQVNHVKLIIAPRHLERVGEVEELLRRQGLAGGRISRLLEAPQVWDVALVDSLGQLPTYYALAAVVFVGGSLIPHGGQNPIEPASLGKPVVFGPSMENFAEIAQQLLAHQAALQLRDRAQLATVLHALLANREEASLMGARSQALVERLKGTTQKTVEALQALLTVAP